MTQLTQSLFNQLTQTHEHIGYHANSKQLNWIN